MFENIREDYRREFEQSTYRGGLRKHFHSLTAPGFQAMLGFRMTHWLARKRIPLLGIMIQRITEVWTGVSISPQTKIGPGMAIFHFGGVIINQNAVIGRHCSLHHDVTIGNRVPGGPSPVLGDRVMVGAGARLLGGIKIGSDAEIGANAVVLSDVPDGGIAVGIPAKVIRVKESL